MVGKNKNMSSYLKFTLMVMISALVPIQASAQKSAPNPSQIAVPSKATGASPGSIAASDESPAKTVLKVGSTQVTAGDIENLINNLAPQARQALATQGRQALGDEYMKLLLLSHQAEADHLDTALGIRERLDLQRNQILAMAEYQKMAQGVTVSPDEISQYFTAHQSEYETAQVRQFVIRKKADGAPANAPGLATADAHAKAEAIRKALAAGSDPKKVAQDFAVPNVVLISPDPQSVQRGKMMPVLDKAAFTLKPGEVSEAVDTPQAVVFLQVVGRKPADPKSAATEIETAIKQQKLDAEVAELKKNGNVWMDEDYFKGPEGAPSPSAPLSPAIPPAHH